MLHVVSGHPPFCGIDFEMVWEYKENEKRLHNYIQQSLQSASFNLSHRILDLIKETTNPDPELRLSDLSVIRESLITKYSLCLNVLS
jgi:hypothetical protein